MLTEPPAVTVLCYHNFDGVRQTAYDLPMRRFEEQLQFLSVQRHPVISLAQLDAYVLNGTPVPPRAVLITIDDGYKSAKTVAWPLIKRYGFPFTLFVYPQAIGRHRGALTWDDLREMAGSGVDVQSHTLSHAMLTHPSRAMPPAAYGHWLDQELAGSKRLIEQQAGRPVTALAYPYGAYDEHVMESARDAGYRLAFTCDSGSLTRAAPPYRLNRRVVTRRTSRRAFARYLTRLPLIVEPVSPRAGERLSQPPQELVAWIRNRQHIRPETLQVSIDKLGPNWIPSPMDSRTGMLHFQVPPTSKTGFYYVNVSAEDKVRRGIYREASWLFIVKKNNSKKQIVFNVD